MTLHRRLTVLVACLAVLLSITTPLFAQDGGTWGVAINIWSDDDSVRSLPNGTIVVTLTDAATGDVYGSCTVVPAGKPVGCMIEAPLSTTVIATLDESTLPAGILLQANGLSFTTPDAPRPDEIPNTDLLFMTYWAGDAAADPDDVVPPAEDTTGDEDAAAVEQPAAEEAAAPVADTTAAQEQPATTTSTSTTTAPVRSLPTTGAGTTATDAHLEALLTASGLIALIALATPALSSVSQRSRA